MDLKRSENGGGHRLLWVVCIGWSIGLTACGPEGPAPGLIADARALKTVVDEDPAREPLEEADRISGDRPVLAGEMIGRSVVPLATRQLERVRGVSTRSEEGGRFKSRLARIYQERLEALELYRQALEDAASDPEAVADALHAQSDNERALLALRDELDEVLESAR